MPLYEMNQTTTEKCKKCDTTFIELPKVKDGALSSFMGCYKCLVEDNPTVYMVK